MVGEEEEGSFLSEDDEDEIEAKEKAKGRRKAVDLLLLKLMQLKQPGWHEGLLAGLKQEVPKLVPVVTQARDDLLKDTWFRHMPISATENEHQCTGEFTFHVRQCCCEVDIILKMEVTSWEWNICRYC